MKTPIADFVRAYAQKRPVRMHMPGHKGVVRLGPEPFDLTEIKGADSLFAPRGIIAESEANASELFGCPTFYSTEGSSLCVKTMLYLAVSAAREKRPLILAGRNAHRSFTDAAALLDFETGWMYGDEESSYLGCGLRADGVEKAITQADRKPCAVYLTSPDYLGQTVDLAGIAAVCKKHGVLLLVDNAHGAYLKFLSRSRHPIDLGADLCCDSAHKTLPVLTGGAYLHLSASQPNLLPRVSAAMAVFGSTSPSYLILQSLDLANSYLEGHRERLKAFLPTVARMKEELRAAGFELIGDEPLKVTVNAAAYGYEGTGIAERLREAGIECEFADRDAVVCMISPEQQAEDLDRYVRAMRAIGRKTRREVNLPQSRPERVMTPREVLFCGETERLPIGDCLGRICAESCIACPPATAPVVCGERIDADTLTVLEHYGMTECQVVADKPASGYRR